MPPYYTVGFKFKNSIQYISHISLTKLMVNFYPEEGYGDEHMM
jgi:hypothetical protein